jgi:hypothetical protein
MMFCLYILPKGNKVVLKTRAWLFLLLSRSVKGTPGLQTPPFAIHFAIHVDISFSFQNNICMNIQKKIFSPQQFSDI